MPTIPRLERQVATQAVPAARLATTVPIGDTSRSQKAALAVLIDAKKTGDQLAVNDAFNASMLQSNELMDSARSMLGRDAIGSQPETQAQWSAHVDSVAGNLQSEDQKIAYQAKADALWLTMDRQLQTHTRTETLKYDNKISMQSIESMQEAAAKAADDPELTGIYINAQRELITEWAERNGQDAQPLIDEAVSASHKRIIDQKLVDGNDIAATEYYKEHRAEIQNDARTKEKLSLASTDGNAARTAQDGYDDIKPDELTGKKDITSLLREIRNSGRPQKEIDKAVARVKVLNSERNVALKQVHDTDLSTIYDLIADPDATEEDLRASEAWPELTGKEHNSALKELRSGKAITEEQRIAYNDLASDPAALIEMTKEAVAAKTPELGGSLTDRLQRLRLATIKDVDSVVLKNNTFNEIATQFGFRPFAKKKGETAKAELAGFRLRVEEAVRAEQKKVGRDLTMDEVREVMQAEAENKIRIDGGYWGFAAEVPVIALTEEQEGQVAIPDVDRTAIRNSLIARGKPVNRTEIIRVYLQAIKNAE